MTTDLDGLLAGILASPDDDLPRLMYADALDEAGEHSRAEFIRVQVEIARIADKKGIVHSVVRGDLLRRADELLHASLLAALDMPQIWPAWSHTLDVYHWSQWWINDWFEEPNRRQAACYHHRGFVEAVIASQDLWFAHGDHIIARHPIREVRLVTWPEVVSQTYERERHTELTLTAGARQASFTVEHRLIHHIGQDRYGEFYRGIVDRLLYQLWPTVRFVLPAGQPENIRVALPSL